MKPATVFLGEMTNLEVEAFLQSHHTVIVPVGATEQHGPHGPLLTDVLIPQEVARRVAPRIGAVVAPPVNYALSYPHVGFRGLVHIRIPTFMALIEDLCVSFATAGFKRIVFLNGHYDNTYAIAYACANAADKMATERQGVSRSTTGTASRRTTPRRTSDWRRACTRTPPRPRPCSRSTRLSSISTAPTPSSRRSRSSPSTPAPCTRRIFFTTPGSVFSATRSGTWGDARDSSPELGERYLEAGVRSTIAVLDNIERTFEAMPRRTEGSQVHGFTGSQVHGFTRFMGSILLSQIRT